jgi:hypothetical protein
VLLLPLNCVLLLPLNCVLLQDSFSTHMRCDSEDSMDTITRRKHSHSHTNSSSFVSLAGKVCRAVTGGSESTMTGLVVRCKTCCCCFPGTD